MSVISDGLRQPRERVDQPPGCTKPSVQPDPFFVMVHKTVTLALATFVTEEGRSCVWRVFMEAWHLRRNSGQFNFVAGHSQLISCK